MRHSLNLLALAGAASVIAISSPVMAQSSKTATFNIEAQKLGDALTEFGIQGGEEVYFVESEVRGKATKGVKGKYTLKAAIQRLLDGTGVTYTIDQNGAVIVGKEYVRRAQQNATRGDPGEAGDFAPVTGKLTDERTGGNLKGARVTIEETGQATTTDGLGNYRFPRVRPGTYALRISYLGYQDIFTEITVQAGRPFNRNFGMTGGSANAEIVVYGQRSARAQALNQERTAENTSTVLSGDLLGQFDGTTVSESLRRAPGVSFQQSPVTGDGTNVIVRGLEPDLNTVSLNGLRLAESSGIGRSANLSNILTDSISKITISKSLLPSQDSSGTGGLIDIETKSPLDRPKSFASFGVEGAKTPSNFLEDYLLTGTLSRKFGVDDNFGISASVQYRNRNIQTFSYRTAFDFGQYLPLAKNGSIITSTLLLDPQSIFPFEPNVDEVYPKNVFNEVSSVETSNLSTTVSVEWQVADHTNLRLDYIRAEEKVDNFVGSLQVGPVTRYTPVPVEDIGGEVRAALIWEDAFAFAGFPGALKTLVQTYSGQKSTNTSNTLSFRGSTNVDRLEFKYSAGIAKGKSTSPNQINLRLASSFSTDINNPVDRSLLLPEAISNTANGQIVSLYSPRIGNGYPLPLLNQAGFDFFNDPGNLLFNFASIDNSSGENTRYTGKFSTKYHLDGKFVKYIEAGGFYESTKFESDFLRAKSIFSNGLVSTSDIGLGFQEASLDRIGLIGGFSFVPRTEAQQFFANFGSIAQTNPNLFLDENLDPSQRAGAFTKEDNFAAYVQSRVDIGNLEIIGGARLDRVRVQARNPQNPTLVDENGLEDLAFAERFTVLVDQTATQTKVLPRVLANYRWNDHLVVRFGYFQTVARPRIEQLSDTKSLFLFLEPTNGPNGDQPSLQIFKGNPDLKPSTTDSFDLSVEYYDDSIGALKVGAFYKKINNLLSSSRTQGFDQLDGVELPDDPRFQNLPSNVFVEGFRPENTPFGAKIWGVEASVEKQFTFLPGVLNGFGAYLNYTYTDSSKTEVLSVFQNGQFSDVAFPDVKFSQDPTHSGTAALTYNKHNIDATLAYTFQDRRLESFALFGLSSYAERDDSLDLRAEYRFDLGGGSWRAYFEGADLLKGARTPDVETSVGGIGATPKVFSGGTFLGGRTFRLGVIASF